MNSPSAFQQQFPLSSKKFWKKLISRTFMILFGSIVLGVVSGMLISLLLVVQKPQNGAGAFLWVSILMVVIFLALIVTLYGAYISAYIRRYYYDTSEQFLTIQKGVFAPTEIHVPYGKIQDVYVDQDVLDRIMGLYDVHIASATMTSGIEAHIDGVDARIAEELKNFLLNKIQYGGQIPQQGAAISQNQAPTAVAPQGPQAGVFNSRNYPIVGAWIFTALVTNLWSSAIYTFIIWIFLLGKRTVLYQLSIGQAFVIYVIIYIILTIWIMLWKATFYFEFLPQFIMMKDGVIKREEKHVPYRTLQNVLLKRSIIERMLGLSTVIIENAAMGTSKTGRASRITVPGQPFAKGNELVNELNRILGQTSGQSTGL